MREYQRQGVYHSHCIRGRYGDAAKPGQARRGFDPVGICLVFGTTAIAGKLLGLGETQMMHALGIAFNRAAGSMQSNIDGDLVVRVAQGFCSQAGIVAAELAARGITGTRNILEGIYGYFNLYSPEVENRAVLTDNLNQNLIANIF